MPDSPDDRANSSAPDRGDFTPTPAPRWVKVLGLAVLVLVALFVIMHLTGTAPTSHGQSPIALGTQLS